MSCNLRPKGLGGAGFVLGDPGVGIGTTVAVKAMKDQVPEECSARARVTEMKWQTGAMSEGFSDHGK